MGACAFRSRTSRRTALLLSGSRGLPGRFRSGGPLAQGWREITPTSANQYKNYTSPDRLTLGGTGNYSPFSWFRNRATVGIDQTQTQAQLLFLPGDIDATQDADAASGANLRKTPSRRVVTLDYSGSLLWNPTKAVQSTTSFGSQVVADKFEQISATGIGIGAVDVTRIDLLQRTTGAESFSENNSVGYYVQEQVGLERSPVPDRRGAGRRSLVVRQGLRHRHLSEVLAVVHRVGGADVCERSSTRRA